MQTFSVTSKESTVESGNGRGRRRRLLSLRMTSDLLVRAAVEVAEERDL